MKKKVFILLLAVTSALCAEPMKIDLSSALLLADGQNTELAVQLQKAELSALEKSASWYQWIPTMRFGAGYTRQDGALQDTDGNVKDVDRSADYKGFGAGAPGSGVPTRPGLSLTLDLAEAFYAPLAARQQHKAVRFESEAVRRKVMLEVAAAYYDLVRAARDVEITAQSAENSGKLARLTADFAASGEGLSADAERAAVEDLIHQQKVELAQEYLEVSSIKLCRLLRLGEKVQLRPANSVIVPLALIDAGNGLQDMFSQSLVNHPGLGATRAVVEAEEFRLQQAKFAPFIPKLEVGYSYGSFGGSAASGSRYDDDRSDLYGTVYWQFESLGLRNAYQVKKQRARILIAKFQEQQAQTDALADVQAASTEFSSAGRQLDLARRAVDRARKAYELSTDRIFEKQGSPLEALQSMKALAEAESLYLSVATKYNLSQLRLVSASGQDLMPQAK